MPQAFVQQYLGAAESILLGFYLAGSTIRNSFCSNTSGDLFTKYDERFPP